MVFFAPMVIGTSLHMSNFLHMHLFPNVKFLSHVINASQSVKIMHMHINLHKMLKKRLIFSFWFFKCHVLIIACFFFMWNNFTILDAWRNLYNPITKKLLEIVRIMHSCRSKVDNSGMPIGSCRPRLGSINWSTMPYSSSRGVHPRPHNKTSGDRHIFTVKQESLHPEELNE